MNSVKKTLELIFGDRAPKTATHFFTAQGLANFEGGRVQGLKQIKMTPEEAQAVETAGLAGPKGWSLI